MAPPGDPTSEQELKLIKQRIRAAKEQEKRLIVQAIRNAFPGQELSSLPTTLRQAYAELLLMERPSLRDFAKFYAHFVVANQVAHDHSSRKQETRDFYRQIAKRSGIDIFPDPQDAKYAKQFDDYLEESISAIDLERSQEQKDYLDFQKQVSTEVRNIQSLMEISDWLGMRLKEAEIPNGSQTMKFLNQTLDNMLKAEKKKGVQFYANEALSILNLLRTQCDPDLAYEIIDTINELEDCVENFEEHHLKIMHTLDDKRRDLHLSTMIRVLALLATSPLVHAGGVGIPDLDPKGFQGLQDLKPSTLLTIGTKISAKAALYQRAADIEGKPYQQPDEEHVSNMLLHNILDVQPKETLADALARKQIEIEQNPKKAVLTVGTVALCVAIGLSCPPAGLAIGAARLGAAATNFYYSQKSLNYVEESAKSRRVSHEVDMQKFLANYPERDRILLVDDYQKRTQKLENLSRAAEDVSMEDIEAKAWFSRK